MRIASFIFALFFTVFLHGEASAQAPSVNYNPSTGGFTGTATETENIGGTDVTTNTSFQGTIDRSTGDLSGTYSSTTTGGGQGTSDAGTFRGSIDGQGNYAARYSGSTDSGFVSGTLDGFSFGNPGGLYGDEQESAASRNSYPSEIGSGIGDAVFASLFGPGGTGLGSLDGISYNQLSYDQQREAVALVRLRRLKLWFLREARNCQPSDTECLSRVLRAYGNHLRAIPVTDSQVPAVTSAVILEAANAVAASNSEAQTRQILQTAIRKIELYAYVRSGDEVIEVFQAQQKAEVLSSLTEYEAEFVRVTGL